MAREATFTTSDGAEIWYELRGEGDGVPLVFCDGLGCDGFIWKYLWEPMTRNHRVLHWNYRGHGRSGVANDATRIGIDYICEDMNALMTHVGMDDAIIFGHSMGVQVALEYHRQQAKRVLGLVLLCGSYGTPLDTWHDHTLMRVFFPLLQRAVETRPSLSRLITSAVTKTRLAKELAIYTELNPKLIRREDFAPYMDHLSKMEPLYFIRTLNSLKDHSAWDHLPHVKVPTIVVGGEIDRFTPVWLSQRMADHIPTAEYLRVLEGSHTAPLERPALVNSAIEQFIRERVEHSAAARTTAPQTTTPRTKSSKAPVKRTSHRR